MTVKKEYLTNNFDAIRLLGALQVIICNHYFFHFKLGHEASLWNAFSGVPIFFFLAGIFIPMSFERNSEILNYARNRILKIFPVMWCSIALSVFLMFVSGFKPEAPLYKFLEWLGVYMVYPLYTPE